MSEYSEAIAALNLKRKEIVARMNEEVRQEQQSDPKFLEIRNELSRQIGDKIGLDAYCVRSQYLAPFENADLVSYHFGPFGSSKNLVWLDMEKIAQVISKCPSLQLQHFIAELLRLGAPRNPSEADARAIMHDVEFNLPKPIAPGLKERHDAAKIARRASGIAPAENDYAALVDDVNDEIHKLEKLELEAEKAEFDASYKDAGESGDEES